MLQILREKAQGLITWLIVLLVAAAFAFFGLTDYFSLGGNRKPAAKINGEKISWVAVENIYKQIAQQYEGQIEEQALKKQILKEMVQRVALMSEAKTLGFRVGEEQVAE